MPSITFRRAQAHDADAILELWRSSGASPTPTDDVPHLVRLTGNPTAALLLALEDGQIVGSLLGTYDGWRGTLYRLVVRADKRRRGIGRDLVRQMDRIFAGWGVKRAHALVEIDRPSARLFWSSVGYAHDDRLVRHVRTLDGGSDGT